MPKLVFRAHAVQRMFERRITVNMVREALADGDTLAEYPEDSPYPSRLVLGWADERPLHIVVADNTSEKETIVITVYEPDPTRWSEGFRRRT